MHMNVYDRAEEKHVSVRQIIDFTLAANPIGPSAKAKNAVRKAVKTISLFPDPEARYLRRFISRTEHVAPENIVFGHGSTPILNALLARLKPKRAAIPSPVPPHYLELLQKHDAEAMGFSLGHEDHSSWTNMQDIMSHPDGIDMLVLPNPHTLTGNVLPAGHLGDVIEKFEGMGKTVILDETLAGFAETPSFAERIARSGNALILRSFSLFHSLAGVRLGYAIGSPEVIAAITADFGLNPVNSIAAAAALASLRDTGFYKRTSDFVRAEKKYLLGKMGRLEGVQAFDTPCNFLLVKIEKQIPEIEKRFLERNIMVTTFRDTHGDDYIRLPVRRHPQNARFAKTLARIIQQSNL